MLDTKKARRGFTDFELENASGETIKVSCPSKIKLGPLQTMMNLRYNIPPMDVTPTDWIGMAKLLGPFVALILCAALNFSTYYVVVGLVILGYNYWITSTYYLETLRKAREAGYEPKDPDQTALLHEAGAEPMLPPQRKQKNLIEWVILGVLGLALIIPMFIPDSHESVTIVQSGSFNGYPEITVKEAVYNLFDDPEWSYVTSEYGHDYVNVEGMIEYDGDFAWVLLQFKVNPESGSFSINAFEIDGEPMGDFMLLGLLSAMLEEY